MALCLTSVFVFSSCTSVDSNVDTITEVITSQIEDIPQGTFSEDISEITTQDQTETTAISDVPDSEGEITEKATLQAESPVETDVTTNTAHSTQIETTVTTKVQTQKSETQVETTATQHDTTIYEQQDFSNNSYKAINYSEQKGFWISYLEYDSILKNKTKSQFTSYIREYFDNIQDYGFNTVYVHARAFGDAYYYSELFPSGDKYSGSMGDTPSFDALQIMIDEGHKRNLSVHAWVNPMRMMTETQMKSLSSSFKVKEWYNNSSTKGKYIVYVNGKWYLNPAYDEVNKFICDGVKEIVSNYNVDGIQIDDYFYPTTATSFDSSAYSNSGTSLSLSKWRIQNTNNMVKDMYSAIKSVNSNVMFGISPQGSIDNNYNELYADVRTWGSVSGYCDYLLPQIYYGFDNSALPYDTTIAEWSRLVSNSRIKLVIGLAGYKIGLVDTYAGNGKNEWLNNNDIISRQMDDAESLSNYGGVALYRYDSIFNPSSDVAKQVGIELSNIEK